MVVQTNVDPELSRGQSPTTTSQIFRARDPPNKDALTFTKNHNRTSQFMLAPSAGESIARIEEQLSKIVARQELPLELPTSLSTLRPGVEVAIIQSIISWALLNPGSPIHSRIPQGANTEAVLKNLLQQPYALTALLARPKLLAAGGRDISITAAALAAEAYRRERTPFHVSPPRREASLIIASQNLAPNAYGPLIALATPDERAARQATFLRYVESALAEFYAETKTTPIYRKESLPSILYELFANAEEWGGTSVSNRPVQIPLRGILLRIHSLSRDRFGSTDLPIRSFEEGLRSIKGCSFLLEVSVFDSGIGLAQRNLRRRIEADEPLTEELKAVQNCLKKHGSSSGSSSRGLGLHYVMDLASAMKGFLRIRSGRLHLYRDFSRDPYLFADARPASTAGQFGQYMRDWISRGAAVLATTSTSENVPAAIWPYAQARGTVFNLLLPLKGAQLTFNYE